MGKPVDIAFPRIYRETPVDCLWIAVEKEWISANINPEGLFLMAGE
jgi:hypothetical protein